MSSQPVVLHGRWQGGRNSAMSAATLAQDGEQVRVQIDGGEEFTCPLADISLSPRVGATPRYLRFANRDGRLEISGNQDFAFLDARVGKRGYRLLARLENHTLFALLAGLVVLGLAVGYFVWGIPAISRVAAQQMPTGMLDEVGAQTLELLQSEYLTASTLPEDKQASVRALVRREAPDFPPSSLHLAGGGKLGANALALPGGAIILTDELVELTDNEAQLLAVFAHELGHIEQRHAVRQILQGTAIGVTIALVGGDVSALGDLLVAMPVVFSQLHYSRAFELEADRYALEFLRQRGLDSAPFAAILTRLHQATACDGQAEACREPGWSHYLSTHPHIDERLEALAR